MFLYSLLCANMSSYTVKLHSCKIIFVVYNLILYCHLTVKLHELLRVLARTLLKKRF
uniref:Uncharacterized protein n=1 Tax=Anguilla anguilla TaxID=7936 RepID=A0A0E9WCI8_ANGAN